MGASMRSGATLAHQIPAVRSQAAGAAAATARAAGICCLAKGTPLFDCKLVLRRGLGHWSQQQQQPLDAVSGGKRQGSSILVPSIGDNWGARGDLLPCKAIVEEDMAVEPTASIIDGKAIAQQIRLEVAEQVAKMKESVGKVPGLAVLLVGSRKDSETYVRSKKKACEEVGIKSYSTDLPEDASEKDILGHIHKFNSDPDVHGILVQLPLPRHVCEENVVGAVSIDKDVDGFHPMNIGRLAMQGREPLFIPCTPRGCIELLLRTGVQVSGKHAVVIGRSNIVGMPAALLLQRHNATVTVVHSYTPDPAAVTRNADIVIAAAGVAHLVRKSWLKPGAVVIDVGINPVEDPAAKRGYRLVGDVCYSDACTIASAVTPVPGGVGPMTIAMLLQNTVESAKRAYGLNGV